ncbi:hypothetical protein NL676_018380 [Syzygium grande]|nr:hypothetical protein NL676_018380 [Syzygium grande]
MTFLRVRQRTNRTRILQMMAGKFLSLKLLLSVSDSRITNKNLYFKDHSPVSQFLPPNAPSIEEVGREIISRYIRREGLRPTTARGPHLGPAPTTIHPTALPVRLGKRPVASAAVSRGSRSRDLARKPRPHTRRPPHVRRAGHVSPPAEARGALGEISPWTRVPPYPDGRRPSIWTPAAWSRRKINGRQALAPLDPDLLERMPPRPGPAGATWRPLTGPAPYFAALPEFPLQIPSRTRNPSALARALRLAPPASPLPESEASSRLPRGLRRARARSFLDPSSGVRFAVEACRDRFPGLTRTGRSRDFGRSCFRIARESSI